MVEGESPEGDVTEATVTFLYQLTPGPCPSSYGFHAAKLAGLPLALIRRAAAVSKAKAQQVGMTHSMIDSITCSAPPLIMWQAI